MEDREILPAAEKIILSRLGSKYKIFGCDPPIDDNDWTFWVELKDSNQTERKLKQVMISPEELEEVAARTRKPKTEAIQEAVRREYGDHVEDLFNERE